MQIKIIQEDLTRMITEYVVKMGVDISNKEMTIEFKAGRKHPSYAVVTVLEKNIKNVIPIKEPPKKEVVNIHQIVDEVGKDIVEAKQEKLKVVEEKKEVSDLFKTATEKLPKNEEIPTSKANKNPFLDDNTPVAEKVPLVEVVEGEEVEVTEPIKPRKLFE